MIWWVGVVYTNTSLLHMFSLHEGHGNTGYNLSPLIIENTTVTSSRLCVFITLLIVILSIIAETTDMGQCKGLLSQVYCMFLKHDEEHLMKKSDSYKRSQIFIYCLFNF